MIHLNPETGEMHSDGDHRVRRWIEARMERLKALRELVTTDFENKEEFIQRVNYTLSQNVDVDASTPLTPQDHAKR